MGLVLDGGAESAGSGVGQGKESVEALLLVAGKVLVVVYGVCAAWRDRWLLVGMRVWGM